MSFRLGVNRKRPRSDLENVSVKSCTASPVAGEPSGGGLNTKDQNNLDPCFADCN